jgi:hypothetical protein
MQRDVKRCSLIRNKDHSKSTPNERLHPTSPSLRPLRPRHFHRIARLLALSLQEGGEILN